MICNYLPQFYQLSKQLALVCLLTPFILPMANAQNVILIIGDGMDDQQITAARNYLHGAQGRTILDTMPIRSAVQVLTVDNEDPTENIYVADSANSATALATGVTTSIGRIATSAKTDKDLTTIIELAEDQGFKTGLVTTASITDATPAAFAAHVSMRGCESPELMVQYEAGGDFIVDCEQDLQANGGLGSISEQLLMSNVDVLLGGGLKMFTPLAEGTEKTLLQLAKEHNYHVINNLEQANDVKPLEKILGLFANKHLAVRMQGTDGRIAEQPEFSFLNYFHKYLGTVTLPDEMSCEVNPVFAAENTPSLKDLSKLALDHLKNDKGFFLMIESASIDKQSHKRNPCGSIGEVEQLFEAVQVALDFAKINKNTLILITADHGQAAQIIPNGSMFSAYGVPIATPGAIARIKTPEGGTMGINYATNESSYEEHTGVNVPLFANKNVQDKDGNNLISSLVQQRDIFTITKTYLGL
jgi:alkaline phosphatase